MPNKILVATGNPGKLKDFRTVLADVELELVTLKDLQITAEPPEDQATFEANSLQKATFYHTLSGLPTLADDGGFEMDFLYGQPGVKSRRWGGYAMTDDELIAMTVEKMRSAPPNQLGCGFRTVVTLVIDNQTYFQTEGSIRGEYREPCQTVVVGYPFRSVVFLPPFGKYFAELEPEVERRISHHHDSIQKIVPFIKQHLL